MNKFEKYHKYVSMVYALYLPINFFVHIIGVYNGSIKPHFTIILDLIRVVVIAAFAFVLAKEGISTEQEKKAPSQRIMMFAGIAFLEWILNIVTSNRYLAADSHTYFYIVFWGLFLAGYFYETVAICKIIKLYDGINDSKWKLSNLLVVVSGLITWGFRGEENGTHIFVTMFFIALRAFARAYVIHFINVAEPKSEAASEET